MASKKGSNSTKSISPPPVLKPGAWASVVNKAAANSSPLSKSPSQSVSSRGPSPSTSAQQPLPQYVPVKNFDRAKLDAFLTERWQNAVKNISKKQYYKPRANNWNSVSSTKRSFSSVAASGGSNSASGGDKGGKKLGVEGFDVLQELNRSH